MDIHQNARLTPHSREALAQKVLLCQLTTAAAARAYGITAKTAAKWVQRYQREGRAGLRDRSSRPHRSPRRTPWAKQQQVESLRRQRWTGWRIAQTTGLSRATVSRILRHIGLERLRRLDPPPPVVRYEYPYPGALLHLDIKALGRFSRPSYRYDPAAPRHGSGAGWEYLHVAIDDYSRFAFAQILPDQSQASARSFLDAALAHFAQLGVRVERLMTDNGGCYRSHRFRRHVRRRRLRHLFTRPYTPRTNGKAERFIKTMIAGWNDGAIYATSRERAAALDGWLWTYNHRRPHGALSHQPPIARLNELNNLPGFYT
jgi:transposase InsO family protein